jgi:NAD(P)-dependent dehydrogenase (short-subunit alcohol dehydrogenase family)
MLDLSEYASISAFVDRFGKDGGGRLDILILSAAVCTRQFEYSKEGWESTFAHSVAILEKALIEILIRLQINHLGTALLALLLVPYLSITPQANNSPRIVVVSSDVHYSIPRLKEADSEHILLTMNNPEESDMNNRYYASKCEYFLNSYGVVLMRSNLVMNILFTRAFASRLMSSSPITINSANPGFCKIPVRLQRFHF